MNMSNKLAAQFKIKEKLEDLEAMQAAFVYQAKQLSEKELVITTMKKMSRYARFSKEFARVARAFTGVGESVDNLNDTPQTEEIAHGFHIATLVLSIYNFFRIPFMYLTAFILKEPIPFTLSNNSRWAYAAVLLALGITAIAAPITAPIIAFVAAGIGFVASTFFLGKVLYERYKLNKESKQLEENILIADTKLQALQEEAIRLESIFNKSTDKTIIIDACVRVEELKDQYKAQIALLKNLHDQKAQNAQLKEKLGLKQKVFKSVSLILATATIIGLVVSLFFPPAGLAILASVAIVGATYVLARVMTPLILSFGQWLKAQSNSKPQEEVLGSDENDFRLDALLDDKKAIGSASRFTSSPSVSSLSSITSLKEPVPESPVKKENGHFKGSTSEVLRDLSAVEDIIVERHLDKSDAQKEPVPVMSSSLFSAKPSSSMKVLKEKKKEDEDELSDNDHSLLN